MPTSPKLSHENNRLSRCSTPRGPDPWHNQGVPAKVGARESFLFTESSLVVQNKEHLVGFVVALYIYDIYHKQIHNIKCTQMWCQTLAVGCFRMPKSSQRILERLEVVGGWVGKGNFKICIPHLKMATSSSNGMQFLEWQPCYSSIVR